MLSALFSPRLLRPLFWLLLAFSLVMALLPKPPSLSIDRLGDKFEHVLAFVVLTMLARLAWPRATLWQVLGGLSLYGIAIELLQMIPALHRDGDWRDWLADVAAIALAAILAQFLIRFIPPRDTN